VALVHAPAGYGKTTLLVDLVHDATVQVCWVSLDDWDRDVTTFLRYLRLAVLQQLAPTSLVDAPRSRGVEPRAILADLVDRIAGSAEEVWILLDDFHAVEESGDVLGLVDYLMLRLPANARVLIASRTRPPLPCLPRLRLEGRLTELGPQDLAFTADEVHDYYRSSRGETLTTEDVDRLITVTEGWAAGVVLIERDYRLVGAGSETPVELADYIAAEVFDRLPPDLQRFLTSSSVLEVLDAEGCQAITQDVTASRLLGALEGQNVPVLRIAGDSQQYRLHPLLRDFLRAHLRSMEPELYRTLNGRAGSLALDRRKVSEAIRHFAEAQQWDDVAAIIEREAPSAYRLGKWQTILSWLELLPLRELKSRGALRIWEGRIMIRLGQADTALRVLDEASALELNRPQVLAVEIETLRAAAFRVKGDAAAALRNGRSAVESAIRGNASVDALADARLELALVLVSEGSFSEAVREFQSVLEVHEQRGEVEQAAFVNGCLGSAFGSLGKLGEAAVHLEQARQQWRKVGNAKELSWVLNNLGMAYFLMGHLDLARELFHECLSKARDSGNQRAEAYALDSLADLERHSGNNADAIGLYDRALSLASELGEMSLVTQARTGLACSHSQSGESQAADAYVQQALASARERGSTYDLGLAQLAAGVILRQQGKRPEAIERLVEAVRCFEASGANRELAQSLLTLADACLNVRKARSQLNATLERLAILLDELGHAEFLTPLLDDARAVLQYAASRKLGGLVFRELLRRPASPGPGRTLPTGVTGRHALPVVEVAALGGFETKMDGRAILNVEWESEKSKELLLLLLTAPRSLTRDEVVAALWPDAGGRKATSAFHSTLYRLRQALYPDCVIENDRRYGLQPAGTFAFDVREFQIASDGLRGAQADRSVPLERLRQAVGLYEGAFAPSVDGEWARPLRGRLEETFLDLAARLADRYLEEGDYAAAAATSEDVLTSDPYNEVACERLMKAYAALGDIEGAIRSYRRFCETLEADLGEGPAPRLERLHDKIRARLRESLAPRP